MSSSTAGTTNEQQTRAQQLMGELAPKLVELTDSVLYGDVWKRPGLSQRDRSLITVAALVSLYRSDQLKSHMGRALNNGLTVEELSEVITHLAFYAGWPCAVNAVTVLQQSSEDHANSPAPEPACTEPQPTGVEARNGEALRPKPTSKGSADRFTGDVWVDMIVAGQAPSRLSVGKVHFAPSAHTAWHRHTLGQTLHVTEGIGLVQSRGGEVMVMRPGDTIYTPPGVWHWHGAAPDHFMTHLAMSESSGNPAVPDVEWGEHVNNSDYHKAAEVALSAGHTE